MKRESVFNFRLASHDDEFYWIQYYHKKKVQQSGVKVANSHHNYYSRTILDLKERSESALRFFFGVLDRLIAEDAVITAVPGHSHIHIQSGMELLVNMLVYGRRVNALGLLTRHASIPKLASGGNRNINVHLSSISVQKTHKISTDSPLLLLDDVLTTGNSLRACKHILQDAGFSQVTCLALGKTVERYE
jgi:predicted amidophosphoribosyltransferase